MEMIYKLVQISHNAYGRFFKCIGEDAADRDVRDFPPCAGKRDRRIR